MYSFLFKHTRFALANLSTMINVHGLLSSTHLMYMPYFHICVVTNNDSDNESVDSRDFLEEFTQPSERM